MRCKTFRELELETARLADHEPDEARSHAASCSPCAEWLTTQRRLTASFSTLAENLAEQGAPPEVEAALVMAFRRGGRVTSSATAPSATPLPRFFFWLPASLAAAAVAAAFVAGQRAPSLETARPTPAAIASSDVPVGGLTSTGERSPAGGINDSAPSRERPAAPARLESTPLVRRTASPATLSIPAASEEKGEATMGPSDLSLLPMVADTELPAHNEALAMVGFDGLLATADGEDAASENPFVPLGPADTPVLLEGGQVLRVEITPERARSAGLPVDANAGRASIRADVVVGHDGIARAIRLIKER